MEWYGRARRTSCQGAKDRGEYRRLPELFAQDLIRSVELIVQPDAKDGVGEMRVCVWSARRDLIDGRGRRLRGIFSARSLPRVFAIGLAGCIIGADSSNNLLPRVVQCVAERRISRVGW